MILAFGGEHGFGIGLGNIILLVNVVMLWAYTLSCHSCRHATGGRLRNFSKNPIRYRWWTFVSRLNTRHGVYAWISLGTLALRSEERRVGKEWRWRTWQALSRKQGRAAVVSR